MLVFQTAAALLIARFQFVVRRFAQSPALTLANPYHTAARALFCGIQRRQFSKPLPGDVLCHLFAVRCFQTPAALFASARQFRCAGCSCVSTTAFAKPEIRAAFLFRKPFNRRQIAELHISQIPDIFPFSGASAAFDPPVQKIRGDHLDALAAIAARKPNLVAALFFIQSLQRRQASAALSGQFQVVASSLSFAATGRLIDAVPVRCNVPHTKPLHAGRTDP